MLVLRHQLAVGGLGALLVALHALLVENALSLLSDFADALHGLEGGGDEVAVVADWDVAASGECEGAVDDHLLSGRLAESLGPLELSWVTLHLELFLGSVDHI